MNTVILKLFGLDQRRNESYRALIGDSYRRFGFLGVFQVIFIAQQMLFVYLMPIPEREGAYLKRWILPATGALFIAVWFYGSFRKAQMARVFRSLPVTRREINRIGWAHVLVYFPLALLAIFVLIAVFLTSLPNGDFVPLHMFFSVLFLGIVFGYRWIGFGIASLIIVFGMPDTVVQLNTLHMLVILAAIGAIAYAIRNDLPAQSELMRASKSNEYLQRWRAIKEIPKAYPSWLYQNSRGLIRALGISIVLCPLYIGVLGFFAWSSLEPYVDKFMLPEPYAVHIVITLFLVIAIGTNSHRERLSVYRTLPITVNQLAAAFWVPCVALACIVYTVSWILVRVTGELFPWTMSGFDLVLFSGLAAILSLDNVLPTEAGWVLVRFIFVPILTVYAGLLWLGGWIDVTAGVTSFLVTHLALVGILRRSSAMYRGAVAGDHTIN